MENTLVSFEEKTVLTAFTKGNGLDPIVQQAKDLVEGFEHDLSNGVSRAKTASLASKVGKLKVKLDGMGKDLVSDWKEKAKVVDKSRKSMRDALDILKVEARKPLSDWEDEQKVIEAERLAKEEAEKLAIKIDTDHEIGLLLNEKLDRDVAELKIKLEADKKVEADRLEKERIEREEKLKSQAAKEATEKAESLAKKERERVEKEKQKLIDDAAAAEREKIAAQEREKIASEQAKKDKIAAAQKVKQDAIDAENKRLADVEQAKKDEIFRQQEEIRIADEEAKGREANKKYLAKVHNGILTVLMKHNISEDDAKTMIKLAAKGLLPQLTINY